MFRNLTKSGSALMTDPADQTTATFTLDNTNHIVANTLRRCILMDTRSVGFRADLTNAANPGVSIRRNTSVVFNEMLAHRLTLIPLGIRRLDDFVPANYECVLRVRNDRKGPIDTASILHVKSGDFTVREKQADGTFADLGAPAAAAMFPADPVTRDTVLITTLRPQWNAEQPPEEVDLTAYPVIGTGRNFIGFSPVCQCAFRNTPDPDPVRQETFFTEWLRDYKKMADASAVAPDVLGTLRQEWQTMAIQRCFLVDDKGEPNSFQFTVESVGVRPVSDIVAEGIRAVIALVEPFAAEERTFEELNVTSQPTDSRSNGLDLQFAGHDHTLGNLLQMVITELYLDNEAPDTPLTSVGYKIRHPLHRVMTLRLNFREGVSGDTAAIARQVVAAAAGRARQIFEELGRSWASLVGGETGAGGEAVTALEG